MKKISYLLAILFTTQAFCDTDEIEYVPPAPEVIDSELSTAEAEFLTAQKMFNPWYAGPLITGGATNLSPGLGNVQPYLYVTNSYATYDGNRKTHHISTLTSINPVFLFQTGVTNWLDTTVTIQALFNHQHDKWSNNLADTSWGIGLQLARETQTRPAFRATITQTFPTGKYDKLDPDKLSIDSTGAGTYATNFGLNMSKVIWQVNPLHPMQVRANLNYKIALPTHVNDFNAYGGGYGTNGKVKPGNTFNVDIGFEYSFTQRWVFALDTVYSYFNRSSFSGEKGVDTVGNPAVVGGPSGDQLSFAPAIEYNPSSTFGYVGGVWFTATGRNSTAFVSAVFTFYAVF